MTPASSPSILSTTAAGPLKPNGRRPKVVHWYRTDLRVHDSPSLARALALEPEVLWPVWTWDPAYIYQHRVGANRWRFLLDAMSELSCSLTAINPDQRLLVLRGAPDLVFDWVFTRWEGVTHLVYEIDTSAYARSRDEVILALAKEKGIEVIPVLGHTLYSIPDIIKHNGGKATTTAAQLEKAASKLPAPPRPLPPPTVLPRPGPVLLPDDDSGFLGQGWEAPIDLNSAELGGDRTTPPTCFSPSERVLTTVPSLKSLSLDPDLKPTIPAGESAALQRLMRLCADEAWVAGFAKPKSAPTASVDDFLDGTMYRSDQQGKGGKRGGDWRSGGSTFVLSPFLKFGCLSVRKFYHDAADAIESFKKQPSSAAKKSIKVQGQPENLVGQLIFREMYIAAEYATPNFNRIQGNKLCRFIDWKCQTQYSASGAEIVPRPPDKDALAEEHLQAWTFGRTGFPWIDALMRQLRKTGWIHHLGRHSVACFLTRGNLYISWERGQEVFDELLLDWDPAANGGNWMWLSCSAFFSMYYRVYSPVTFPVKWDKTGALPMDRAPHVLKKAGIVLGETYPHPIIDYKQAQDDTVAKIKSAYAVNLHGADAAVLDGRAGKMLKDAFERGAGKGAKSETLEKAKKDVLPEGKKRAMDPFTLAKENAEKRRKLG